MRVRSLMLGVVGAAAFSTQASAESKSFVVSWFYPATYTSDADCPTGMNDRAEAIFLRILRDLKTPPAEIEKLMADFPHSWGRGAGMRGRINGKPTNVYLHPTSTPDPNLKTAQGTVGLGFNLDGKDTAGDFVDPETGEKGVDHQFIACSPASKTPAAAPMRGRPTRPFNGI